MKKWIQKLNSYFADFEQVKNVACFFKFEQDKKMLVILLTLGYWHKNVISYFADFELLIELLFLDGCF